MLFDSSIWYGESFGPFEPSQEQIKAEPMFFNSSWLYAIEHGGPITRTFLKNLPKNKGWESGVFDSRVHMLMPGWYPAIPGWHHDDVPRPKKIKPGTHFMTAGQPDYKNMTYKSEHIMGLCNGDICPTQFACGQIELPDPKEGELVYRKWHPLVNSAIEKGELILKLAPSLRYIHFDWQSFHQGQKTVGNGWRWFGRITKNSDRCKPENISNEIRTQVQVYLEFPMEGW